MKMYKTRPYVICHMLSSIDGKIDGSYFQTEELTPVRAASHELRTEYDADAVSYGAVTAGELFAVGYVDPPKETTRRIPRKPYVADENAERFTVVVDTEGSLRWNTNQVVRSGQPRSHIVIVLTESVSDAYLEHLQKEKISYLFAGAERLEIGTMLKGLKKYFAIDFLIISGGGIVNWSFLQEGYIDELSLVICPLSDGRTDTATLFDRSSYAAWDITVAFSLEEVKRLKGDGIRLKYIPKNRKEE